MDGMSYTRATFTCPTTNKKMTDVEYEVAVGLRCPKCKRLVEECRCSNHFS